MRRGTTPTHTFTLPIDAAQIDKLRITYVQKEKIVLKKTEDDVAIDGNAVRVKLTQAETLQFDESSGAFVSIQIKVLTTGGDVLASEIFKVHPLQILDEEELV